MCVYVCIAYITVVYICVHMCDVHTYIHTPVYVCVCVYIYMHSHAHISILGSAE